jgi:hypothetical protein
MTEQETELVAMMSNLEALLQELHLLVRHLHLEHCPECRAKATDADDPYASRH